MENTISFEELYYQLKMRANRSARTLGNAREGLEKLPSPAREILFSLRASACRTLLPREILASLLPCVYRNEPQPCRTVSARFARDRAQLAITACRHSKCLKGIWRELNVLNLSTKKNLKIYIWNNIHVSDLGF